MPESKLEKYGTFVYADLDDDNCMRTCNSIFRSFGFHYAKKGCCRANRADLEAPEISVVEKTQNMRFIKQGFLETATTN